MAHHVPPEGVVDVQAVCHVVELQRGARARKAQTAPPPGLLWFEIYTRGRGEEGRKCKTRGKERGIREV